ncbi:hypothetical protein BBJ29_007514 [Phytophthora kernoviae]|uniref:Selenoprotein O n=1 Tax=Phytophthora kernoviae TaxID=325452 RepID=A0A3F2RIM2_9STRA|nr:hypothetical protein BBJ29_007514 [Phytophthora kernoviae]RLN57779.1 hypothetical protein BBP00_00007353 [Phytophthora kernoviae]
MMARIVGAGSSAATSTGRSRLSRAMSHWRVHPSVHFDNSVLRSLPLDSEPQNFVRNPVKGACFSPIQPTPIVNPELVVASRDALSLAGIELRPEQDEVQDEYDLQPIASLVPGRYRYEAQPEICKWNCGVFADQLGLVMDRTDLQPGLDAFDAVYEEEYMRLMREKLGLTPQNDQGKQDKALTDTLFDVLAHTGADFTCTFRYLSQLDVFGSVESRDRVVQKLVGISETLAQQKRKLELVMGGFSDAQFEMIAMLLQENPARASQYGITPALVAQMATQRKEKELLAAATDDGRMNSVRAAWQDWIDVFVSRIRDEGDAVSDAERRSRMLAVNPLFVLRNHVAQKAIDLAHDGDYASVRHIFELMTHPFDELSDDSDLPYTRPQDPTTAPLCVSCSS